jgi:hypothetical protein
MYYTKQTITKKKIVEEESGLTFYTTVAVSCYGWLKTIKVLNPPSVQSGSRILKEKSDFSLFRNVQTCSVSRPASL